MTTRTATVDDVVRRLTDTGYQMTAESALAWGMGDVDGASIRPALDAAIAQGLVRVVDTRDTTYGKGVRFVALNTNELLRAARAREWKDAVRDLGDVEGSVTLEGTTLTVWGWHGANVPQDLWDDAPIVEPTSVTVRFGVRAAEVTVERSDVTDVQVVAYDARVPTEDYAYDLLSNLRYGPADPRDERTWEEVAP